MKEIEEIPAYLPSGAALRDSVQRARDWLQDVEALQVGVRSWSWTVEAWTERPFPGGHVAHSVPGRPHSDVFVHLLS